MTTPIHPLVHGHRGARALLPENSLPAFERALEAGADVLELDMAVTSDDQVVVSHDLVLSADKCQHDDGAPLEQPYVVREHTLAEVKQFDCGALKQANFPDQKALPGTRLPTLDEVFDLVERVGNTNVQFNIETKIKPAHPGWAPAPDRFAELVIEVLERRAMVMRTYLQSFDHRTLRAARNRAPSLRRVMLTSDNLVDFVALARAEDAHISPDKAWITRDDVTALHEAGYEVIPWTANTPADWERLVAMNVDAIISDDPGALIAWLQARGLRD